MDWAPIVSAAVIGAAGLVGATGWHRLRLTGRIRQELVEEVGLMNSLPEGRAKDELTSHIERRVRLLVAEQENYTANERLNRRWAAAFVVVGFVFLFVVAADLIGATGWVNVPITLLALVGIVAGMSMAMNAHEARNERRWAKSQRAEDAAVGGQRPPAIADVEGVKSS